MTAAGPKRLQLGCYVAHASETTYPPHRLPYTGRPVRFRIDFEILLFVFVCLFYFFEALHGLALHLWGLLNERFQLSWGPDPSRWLLLNWGVNWPLTGPPQTCTLSKPALKSFFIDWLLNQSCKYFILFRFYLCFVILFQFSFETLFLFLFYSFSCASLHWPNEW